MHPPARKFSPAMVRSVPLVKMIGFPLLAGFAFGLLADTVLSGN